MSKDILQSIINEFDVENFIQFFRTKNDKLRYPDESIASIPAGEIVRSKDAPATFTQGRKLAEGELDDGTFIVCSFLVEKELTERSSKKAQYNLGKKILKDQQADAGIFIFYDPEGKFRFSLIYTNYLSKRRDWSNFKRFTYFVSKEQTNKTFLQQIGEADFSTIEQIKEAFSVEPVTKQFYHEIQNWYFWAQDKIKFPDDYKHSADPHKDKEIRNATNLIRLITRIIFIWFLKEKGLIPQDLFSKGYISKIVKNFMNGTESSNYYNAILQNLFFATLNQKMSERKFVEEGGFPANKKEYGVKNLYRYADKFLISKDEVIKLFKDIPFLNGGLFDCLDKEDETGKVIYIDGFSRNPKKQAIIPDYLFFQKEEGKIDLSEYGLGSNRPVRGLIEILNNYNFTIDENTPVDQEIALDPELLGKVFENLLAAYNPETATTARKATGSYYTPREIVDYMVEESLFQYLNSTASITAGGDDRSKDAPATFTFLNPNDEINIYQGNLPHWQQAGVFYFVTFRLADSIPKEKMDQLRQERELWLAKHSKGDKENYSVEELREYYRLFSERVEEWLDAGKGSCILKQEKYAKIVADALMHFNNERYILDEWVIMPNHVHVLVQPINNHNLTDILHSWKSYTANEINKLSGNKGQLWMHESYDHIVRNERALEAIRNYIRQNPIKAGIVLPECAKSTASIPAGGGDNRSKDAPATISDKKKREERLKEINETFDESINYPDYARKLYLIENCIYGVDIQPIAIQISKLRFFISLVLDQKVDKNKENFGIRALPNLETKFVAANTLIGLDKPQQLKIKDDEIEKMEEKLKQIRHKYFEAKTRKEKLDYQKKDAKIREEIAELLKHSGWDTSTAEKIASFDLYDQNASADWFDPEWMFGVSTASIPQSTASILAGGEDNRSKDAPATLRNGFDVVIANPPYIQLQKAFNQKIKYADLYKEQKYQTFDRTGDIYCLFYEKGIQLLKPNGLLCYITSNKWMRAGYGGSLRKFFLKFNPKILIDLGPNVFENATVDTNILLIAKQENKNKLLAVTVTEKNKDGIDFTAIVKEKAVTLNKLTKDAWFIGSSAEQQLKEKIERIGKPLKDWDVKIYRGVLTGLNEAFIITTEKRDEILANCKTEEERQRTEAIIKPILRGRDIKRYYYEWAGLWVVVIPAGWTNDEKGKEDAEKYIEKTVPALLQHLKPFEEKAKKRDDQGDYWWELRRCAYYPEFEKEKVVWASVGETFYSWIDKKYFVLDTNYFTTSLTKWQLGILNSKLIINYINGLDTYVGSIAYRHYKYNFEKIPLPPITSSNQPIVAKIEALVDKILAAKKQNPQTDTKQWEEEIDRLVYDLYGLTEEEIRIVEGE